MTSFLWLPLAINTALLTAGEAVLFRKYFIDLSPWGITAKPFVFSMPLYIITLLTIKIPDIDSGFWPLMLLTAPLTAIGVAFNINAFRHAPLSLTMPLLAFTPAFALVTGFLFLDEAPSISGAFGIVLIMLGSHIINMNGMNKPADILAPLKALANNKGSRYMIIASLLYGLTSVMGKMMVLRSSGVFTGVSVFLVMGLGILGFGLALGQLRFRELFSHPVATAMLGGMTFLEVISHNIAIGLIDAAYMISVKRLNGLFGVLFGWYFFQETQIRHRLAGAILMTAGAVFIAVGG